MAASGIKMESFPHTATQEAGTREGKRAFFLLSRTKTMSLFSAVEMAPRDPILGLNEQYAADTNPQKVNLGVGVYSTITASCLCSSAYRLLKRP